MKKNLVVSRLDGEEIAPLRPSLFPRRGDAGSQARLGSIDGSPAMADRDVAERIEAYEALARAKKLADKPWMSLEALLLWLDEPDGACPRSFCEPVRPSERGGA